MGFFFLCLLVLGLWWLIQAAFKAAKQPDSRGAYAAPAPRRAYVEDFRPRTQELQLDLAPPRLAVRLPVDTSRAFEPPPEANVDDEVNRALETPPAVVRSAAGDDELMRTLGVVRVGGVYSSRGYRFQTLGQAAAYARQAKIEEPPPPQPREASPPAAPPQQAREVSPPSAVPAPPAAPPASSARPPSDLDLTVMGALGIAYRDGLYRCAGYGFTSLPQAMAHARRMKPTSPTALPPRSAPVPVVSKAPPPQPTPPPAPARVLAARWFGAHERVEVAGFQIEGGLIYAGRARSSDPLSADKSLIDPTLAVSTTARDQTGASFSYWPSYSEIPAASRRSYLEWLAGGRCDPSIGIGYVFIYFYGLEHRVFIDKSVDDLEPIVAEVRRLLEIYGANHSFNSYASRLLTAVQLIQETELARPALSPERNYEEWPMPLHIRRYLGAVLAAQTPFEADDALLWVLHLADTHLRTPGRRCFDELTALWRIRFVERFPAGLKVRAPKTRLSGEYRSASGQFRVAISLGDLPDIAAVSAPLPKLQDLLSSCIDDLAVYSRLLGRDPEARGRLDAALCLPAELHGTSFASGVAEVRKRLDAHMGEAPATPTSVRWLCDQVSLELPDPKMSATTQRQLALILDRLDIAFEPDRRYGEGSLRPDGEMVIYRAPAGAPVEAEAPVYVAARTMVEIGALAATADGQVVTAEIDSISTDLRALPELSDVERTRLVAHALWLLRDPPRAQAALNRLMKLESGQRQSITRSALSAVLADGRVQPAEVRFLEKLYKTLGLPQDQVYAALHRGGVRMDEPVTVAAEVLQPGVAIPAEADAPSSSVILDATRLARVRQETSEVSSLLAGIFADPEDPVPETTPAPPRAGSFFPGLDSAHAELLAALLAARELDRNVFEARAKALRLLPDGAIETINDWGFDRFDEPVLEGDDLICLVAHLSEPLHAMRVSS